MKIERRYFLRRGINAMSAMLREAMQCARTYTAFVKVKVESWGIIEVIVKTSTDLLKLVRIHNDQTASHCSAQIYCEE